MVSRIFVKVHETQIICLGRNAADAYKPLEALGSQLLFDIPLYLLFLSEPFLPFRDASMGVCTFKLTVKHCLRALHKAIKLGFFNFDTFNVEECVFKLSAGDLPHFGVCRYEHYECVENGDLNVLIPNKFVACAGPLATNKGPDGFPAMTPGQYPFATFVLSNR